MGCQDIKIAYSQGREGMGWWGTELKPFIFGLYLDNMLKIKMNFGLSMVYMIKHSPNYHLSKALSLDIPYSWFWSHGIYYCVKY